MGGSIPGLGRIPGAGESGTAPMTVMSPTAPSFDGPPAQRLVGDNPLQPYAVHVRVRNLTEYQAKRFVTAANKGG